MISGEKQGEQESGVMLAQHSGRETKLGEDEEVTFQSQDNILHHLILIGSPKTFCISKFQSFTCQVELFYG